MKIDGEMILKRILILATVALTSGCLDFDLATEVDGSFEGIPEDGAVLPFEVRHGDTLILSEDHSFALLGALRVREGAVLVIEPGVTVTAAGSQPPALFIVIEAGARILAEGDRQKADCVDSIRSNTRCLGWVDRRRKSSNQHRRQCHCRNW